MSEATLQHPALTASAIADRSGISPLHASPHDGPVASALWDFGVQQGQQELVGLPDKRVHVISVALSDYKVAAFKDDRASVHGRCPKNAVQIMQAGVIPRATFSGLPKLLHTYRPVEKFNEVAYVPRGAAAR